MADKTAGRLGRMIARGIFLTVVVYLVGSIFVSILVDLYGKPPSTFLNRESVTWCVRQIAGLRDDLERQAILEITRPKVGQDDPAARWNRWFEPWQEQLASTTTWCQSEGEDLQRAAADLNTMARGYRMAVTTVIGLRTQTSPNLDRTLKKITKSTPTAATN